MSVNTDLEKLRLTIGDTDTTAAVFKDAELNWFLSEESSNIPNAALRAAYAAMAKYAHAYDFETDGQKFQRSQRYKSWADLAKMLEAQGATLALGTAVSTVDVTKVDGFSDDVANQDVSQDSTNARQKFYRVGSLDRYP